MRPVGYEHLRQSLSLVALPPTKPAWLKPVTRIEPGETFLSVPRSVAPDTTQPLAHVLFALKHEGVDLQILAQALPRVDAAALMAQLRQSPSGVYIRLACCLWERFTGQTLSDLPAIGGPTVPVFDPARYVTGPERRDPRWRVSFNGLGSLRYCATVERTPWLDKAMASGVLDRTREFIDSLGAGMTDRALRWAYLHETEDSFAIEREAPSEDKARRFIALLHQAHDGPALSEDHLVELQNAAVSSLHVKAVQFRREQNWLRGPARGAAGVTYVPPPPDLVPELMNELMAFANAAPTVIDPIVAAAIVSFGFVFIHPFMDGNGRLSRFLFHQALCRSGRLPKGTLLPVSVAMKRHEDDYLAVLQRYSRPVREFWGVRWIDEGQYDLQFRGDDSLYRYWDATACVEFGYRMAEQALEVELRQETEFLARYDAIVRTVGERFDLRGSDLATLVLSALDNGGKVSNHRRKQFQNRVPDGVFDAVQAAATRFAAPD
ncbi:Fic/DOC family protein [Rhizobacter sp. OV335]|nr:Fic/DOC family protein [Rhizobacter sp. OV335]